VSVVTMYTGPHRVFNRHSRVGGNLVLERVFWIPACAGACFLDSRLRGNGEKDLAS